MDTTAAPVSTAGTEFAAKPDNAGGLSIVDKRKLPRGLRNYLALQDFIDHARRVLPRPIYGYVTGGVEDNMSLRGNRMCSRKSVSCPSRWWTPLSAP